MTKQAPKAKAKPTPKTAKKKTAEKIIVKPPTSREKLEALGMQSICNQVVSGESLRKICIAHDIPLRTANDWIAEDKERSAHYAHARDDRADAVFEALDDVSDDAVNAENAVQVAGLRLKADNMKWKLARMNAKKYGDKLAVGGDADGVPLTVIVKRYSQVA